MSIEVRCKCGKQLQAPDSAAGQDAKCPHCGNTMKVGDPLPSWDPRSRASAVAAALPAAAEQAGPAAATTSSTTQPKQRVVYAALALSLLANLLAVVGMAVQPTESDFQRLVDKPMAEIEQLERKILGLEADSHHH